MPINNSIFRNVQNIKIKNGKNLIHCSKVNWDERQNKNSIIYGSVYELKGMDSKVAIIVDAFRQGQNNQNLVALTRARSKLVIYFGAHFSELLNEVMH